MSLTSVVDSDRNQAFLECHISQSVDLTQAVPTTGASSTFSLQKVFPQPQSCSLSFSPAGKTLIRLTSQSILKHILSQFPHDPIELFCAKKATENTWNVVMVLMLLPSEVLVYSFKIWVSEFRVTETAFPGMTFNTEFS